MAKVNGREYDEYKSSGADESFMTAADYAALQEHKGAWQAANAAGNAAGAQAAHDAAEALRSKYNYSGGQDGSGYDPIKQAASEAIQGKNYGTFSYESAPSYSSKYQSQIDALAKELLSRPAFSYDHTKDPLYAQYEKTYTREGERAMQDTIGEVSARTGGLASSYAASAGTQANDYFMSQLSDKIPELQQLAYSMYQNEGNEQRANLEMLSALEAGDYNKYLTLLGQYNADRNFDYGAGQDAKRWAWDADEREYQREQDTLDRDERGEEREYQREQDALAWSYKKDRDAYGDALDKWQLTGVLDEAGAKALGIPAGTKTSDYQFKLAQEARASASSARSSSGGGGGSSGGGSSGSGNSSDLFADMKASENPYTFLTTNYKKYGVAYNGLTGVWGEYQEWAKGDGSPDGGGKGDIAGQVTNQVDSQRGGTDWIRVPGYSRLTWAELEAMVDSGAIIETYNEKTGKYSYKKNPDYKK